MKPYEALRSLLVANRRSPLLLSLLLQLSGVEVGKGEGPSW